MTRPALSRIEADAIAARVVSALKALAVNVSELYLEPVPAGLLFVTRVSDQPRSCLVPHGYRASYEDVARTLASGTAQRDVMTIDAH